MSVKLTIRSSTIIEGVVMNTKLISVSKLASITLIIGLMAMLAGASGTVAFQAAAPVGSIAFAISGICTITLLIVIARWEISEWRWIKQKSRPH